LFYTQTLQLFTINKIKLNWKLFTRANLNFPGLMKLCLGGEEKTLKLIKIEKMFYDVL